MLLCRSVLHMPRRERACGRQNRWQIRKAVYHISKRAHQFAALFAYIAFEEWLDLWRYLEEPPIK